MMPSALMPPKTWKSLGVCIYCLQETKGLTREHLIPEGLDGKWVLQGAVCEACKRIVNPPEALILRENLHTARVALDIRGKHHKAKLARRGPRMPHKVALGRHGEDLVPGEYDYQPQPDEGLPVLTFVRFPPPSRLHGKKDAEHSIRAEFSHLGNKLRPLPHPSVGTREPMRIVEFAYCLTKWAYSFAVAELGLECCDTADIRDLLLNWRGDALRFAGDAESRNGKGCPHLHWMSWRKERALRIVTVRLFASTGIAPYEVVIGPLLASV